MQMAKQISIIVRKDNLVLGDESTESKRITEGPKSWKSTDSLFSMLGGDFAWFTRADTPSAPSDNAPPTATNLPYPFISFINLRLRVPWAEGLLNQPFSLRGMNLMFKC